MIIALDIAMKLFRTSIKAFVHALLPYFYPHSASTNIESLFKFTKNRALGKPNIIKDKRFIRETLYDFGTTIIESQSKGIIFESEYLTEEKNIEYSRILWMKTIKDGYYLLLPPDPIQWHSKTAENTEMILADEIEAYYAAISNNDIMKHSQQLTTKTS